MCTQCASSSDGANQPSYATLRQFTICPCVSGSLSSFRLSWVFVSSQKVATPSLLTPEYLSNVTRSSAACAKDIGPTESFKNTFADHLSLCIRHFYCASNPQIFGSLSVPYLGLGPAVGSIQVYTTAWNPIADNRAPCTHGGLP